MEAYSTQLSPYTEAFSDENDEGSGNMSSSGDEGTSSKRKGLFERNPHQPAVHDNSDIDSLARKDESFADKSDYYESDEKNVQKLCLKRSSVANRENEDFDEEKFSEEDTNERKSSDEESNNDKNSYEEGSHDDEEINFKDNSTENESSEKEHVSNRKEKNPRKKIIVIVKESNKEGEEIQELKRTRSGRTVRKPKWND